MTVDAASDALCRALASRHGNVSAHGDTVTLRWASGQEVRFRVHAVAKLSGRTAPQLPDVAIGEVPVIVADLVTGPARDALSSAGINWLDRRGHLHIRADGLWIDADVPPDPRTRPARSRAAVSGPAQIAVATAHLVGLRPGVRELARRVGLAAPSISTARARLVDAGLLGTDGRPAVPDLFWALADAWTVDWVDLAKVPPVDERLVLVGSATAALLGAPIVVTADWPLDLLASDAATVDRARLRGSVTVGPGACRVGLSPTPLIADPELVIGHDETGYAIGHPLFVALELAQDPSRGGEALELWQPDGVDRVW